MKSKKIFFAGFMLFISGCASSDFSGHPNKKLYIDNFGKSVSWPLKKDYKDIKFWMSEVEMDGLMHSALRGDEKAFERIVPFWIYVINDPETASLWAALGASLGDKKSILAMYSGLKNDSETTRLIYEMRFRKIKSCASDLSRMLEDDTNPFFKGPN